MSRARELSPSLCFTALVAFVCIVGVIAILLIAVVIKAAGAAPLVLSGEEAQRACTQRCGDGAFIFVDRDTMLQFLRDRAAMSEQLDDAKREPAIERAKARCGL